MRTRFSFAVRRRRLRGAFRSALGALLIAAMLAWPVVARARDAQNNAAATAVGRIQGNDISVQDGIRTIGPSDQGIDVSNGNVVTVHSGKARLTLFSGGRVEICGPARFTVLLSGNAITLALNFGRVRAELPTKTSLHVFTPTIVGTPIDIGGGPRDVTVGLNLDDSLCVLATSGAVQLEHQFSGEKIIVPEAGEFFLNGGQLVPVAGKPGSCNCFADEPASRVVAPLEFAAVVRSKVAPQPQPTAAASAMAVPVAALPAPPSQPNAPAPAVAALATALAEQPVQPEPEPAPRIEYGVLQHANQGHPVTTSAKRGAPAAPPSPAASQTALPALVFSATTPLSPPGPSPDAMVLIREAKVSPEWQFSGHVEPPEFAAAMQHALGEKPVASDQPPLAGAHTPAQPKKNKGGFWAALKRAFGGG